MKRDKILLPSELERLCDALAMVRKGVKWKPSKDTAHLHKRLRMGHLPPHSALAEYEKLILKVVNNGQNAVYLYPVGEEHYYAVRGEAHDRLWLVIFGSNGLMETAFPPIDLEDYLERRGFVLLGQIEEVLRWKESES